MAKSVVPAALILALGLGFTTFNSSAARAQETTFTYQGQLKVGATPASGTYDLVFRLYDAASNGVQLGSTVCVDNVPVFDGIFTAQLDFGQQFATTGPRFLEIEVRSDSGLGCGDGSGFVVLEPRQPITAAPMASHASAAFALDAPDGSPANAVFVDDDGKVGVGTSSPAVQLHVQGATPPVLVLQDLSSAANQAGYLGFWNNVGAETGWVGFGSAGSPQFSVVNARAGGGIRFWAGAAERLSILSTGRVGIGTATPAAVLDVRGNTQVHGDIALGSGATLQAMAGEERLRVIRGRVLSNGTISAGTGFTVTRNSTGNYSINFVPDFETGSQPAVTVGVESSTGAFMGMVVGSLWTGTGVHIRSGGGTLSDQSFHFTAVGPR